MSSDQHKYIALTLLRKCQDGELTEEEEVIVNQWLEASPANRAYYEKMTRFLYHGQEHIPENVTPLHLFRNHIREMNMLHQAHRWRRRWYTIYGISAAAVIVGALLFVLPLWQKSVKNNVPAATATNATNAVQLITSKGEVIGLKHDTTVNNGAVVKDETLIYKGHNEEQPEIHRLVTPPGQKYMVLLSDGSRVWINGSSELEYTTPFSGSERKVSLKGEAYFEVAKSTTPFIVQAGAARINVLGTSFNVNAYNSTIIKTVLMEGGVAVSTDNSTTPTILRPNEMAILHTNTGQYTVKETDAAAWLAWKTGYFSFRSRRMDLVVEIIATHYNAQDVIFREEGLKQQKISAHIDVTRRIDEVLKALSDATGMSIVEKDGTVYVETEP